MTGLSSRWKRIGAIAIFATMLLAIPLASASPPPPPAIPAGANAWAYGSTWVWDCSTVTCLNQNYSAYNNSAQGMTEHVHLFVGINVIYIETDTSTGSSLEVYVSVVGAAYADLSGTCTSSSSGCNGESVNANLSARGYIVAIGYANVTAGTVMSSNGTNEAAVALQNAANNEQMNFTGSYSVSVSGGAAGSSISMNAYAAMDASFQDQASFLPALGLFPTNPSPGDSWTSNSSYNASGSYTDGYHYFMSVPQAYANGMGSGGTTSGCPTNWVLSGSNCVYAGSQADQTTNLFSSGFITLWGQDIGAISMTPVGQPTVTAQVLEIETTGNFGFSQGCLLVPDSASNNMNGPGGIPVPSSAHAISVFPNFVGSSTETAVYHPNETPSGKPRIGVMSTSEGLSSSELPKGQTSPYPQPKSPAQASADAQSNYNMVTSSPSAPGNNMFLILVVVVAAVAVVAIVGAVVWTGRRRRKTPAMAYPPSTPGQPAPMAPAYAPAQAPGTPVAPPSPPQPPRAW